VFDFYDRVYCFVLSRIVLYCPLYCPSSWESSTQTIVLSWQFLLLFYMLYCPGVHCYLHRFYFIGVTSLDAMKCIVPLASKKDKKNLFKYPLNNNTCKIVFSRFLLTGVFFFFFFSFNSIFWNSLLQFIEINMRAFVTIFSFLHIDRFCFLRVFFIKYFVSSFCQGPTPAFDG